MFVISLHSYIFQSVLYFFHFCTVTPPTFSTLPSPQSVHPTQTATFTCSATGDDVKYQWTIGSGSIPSKVTGINTNTLVIPDVRSSDDDTYYCTVSNEGGGITSDPVKLTVVGKCKSIIQYCIVGTTKV